MIQSSMLIDTEHKSAKPVSRGRIAGASKIIRGCVILLAILFTCLWYVLYIGSNRWRVRWDQGVRLPASAREIRCEGHTAVCYFLGNHSSTTFQIDRDDLDFFMTQFKQGVTQKLAEGGFTVVGVPIHRPLPPNGEAGGPSPTGVDYYGIKWETFGRAVDINLWTDWN